MRRDEAEPLEHAQHMAVDDEDWSREPAGIQRGRGDLAADTRQSLQPGQPLGDGYAPQEIDIEIGPFASDPLQAFGQPSRLDVGKGNLRNGAFDRDWPGTCQEPG